MDKQTKQALVNAVPYWWHSIDFGDGVVSPGRNSLASLRTRYERMQVPTLDDKTVLDIGTWDGFFAFEAERRGARRVTALDQYAWCLDLAAAGSGQFARFQTRPGGLAANARVPNYWKPTAMPTKAGFDTAHRILDSMVEQYVDDFATVDVASLGSFDVVFYLGGLYHMENPMQVMRKLACVTRGLAVVETAGIHVPNDPDATLFEFYGANELNNDTSNWWAPSGSGLLSMCRAAGFRDAAIIERIGATPAGRHERCRLVAHAWH